MTKRTCPSCGGKISRDAELCRNCRLDANAIGAAVIVRVSDTHALAEAASTRPRTSGQNRAYHAKCGALARLRDAPQREIKRWVLEQASSKCRREISSSSDLNEEEMSDVLDFLDGAIAEAEPTS